MSSPPYAHPVHTSFENKTHQFDSDMWSVCRAVNPTVIVNTNCPLAALELPQSPILAMFICGLEYVLYFLAIPQWEGCNEGCNWEMIEKSSLTPLNKGQFVGRIPDWWCYWAVSVECRVSQVKGWLLRPGHQIFARTNCNHASEHGPDPQLGSCGS